MTLTIMRWQSASLSKKLPPGVTHSYHCTSRIPNPQMWGRRNEFMSVE